MMTHQEQLRDLAPWRCSNHSWRGTGANSISESWQM